MLGSPSQGHAPPSKALPCHYADMVDRAMLYVGGTRLAWVPTIYWQSSRPDRADVTGARRHARSSRAFLGGGGRQQGV